MLLSRDSLFHNIDEDDEVKNGAIFGATGIRKYEHIEQGCLDDERIQNNMGSSGRRSLSVLSPSKCVTFIAIA